MSLGADWIGPRYAGEIFDIEGFSQSDYGNRKGPIHIQIDLGGTRFGQEKVMRYVDHSPQRAQDAGCNAGKLQQLNIDIRLNGNNFIPLPDGCRYNPMTIYPRVGHGKRSTVLH